MGKTFILCVSAPNHISGRILRVRKMIFSRYGIVSAMSFDEIIPLNFYSEPLDKSAFSEIRNNRPLRQLKKLHITSDAVYAEVELPPVFSLIKSKCGKSSVKGLFEPGNGFFLSKRPDKDSEDSFIREITELVDTGNGEWRNAALKMVEAEYENLRTWEESLLWTTLWETKL